MLSLLGGALGLLLAVWGGDVFKAFAPPGVPRLDEVRVDAVAAGFPPLSGLDNGTRVQLEGAP